MKRVIAGCLLATVAMVAHADVFVSDSDTIAAGARQGSHTADVASGHVLKPGEKQHRGVPLSGVSPHATGSISLIDQAGVKYFINTDITFSTSSSASGAMSEASYTHAVAATTLNGGTTMSTLNDAFDGYNTLCLSLNNTVASCQTGNANFVIYNKNGAASLDGTCNDRQVIFPTQVAGNISMSRRVYVPDNDSYARWLNVFTNTGSSAQTVTAVIANNLGSDSNTVITASSTGSTTSPINDTSEKWVATFQNYSGTTTSDPRLGHVLEGAGATVPLAGLNFANGDDNPYWGYTFTVQPGQTRIIMNFVTAQPSKAGAAAQAARLAGLPADATDCITPTELTSVANFVAAPAAPPVQAPGPSAPMLALLTALLAALGLVALRVRLR